MEHYCNIIVDDRTPLALLRLEGSLAQLEVYKFRNRVEKLVIDGARYVIIEMNKLVFIDSGGIGALVHLRNELANWGGGMVLAGAATPHVHTTLNGSLVGRVIPCAETEFEARQMLRDKFGYREPEAIEVVAEDEVIATLNLILDKLSSIETRLDSIETKRDS